jgi:hypothetical protein
MKQIFILTLMIPLSIGLIAPIAPAQVNTENLRRSGLEPGLSSLLSLDFGLDAGNSDFLNLEGGFRTDYVTGAFYFFGVLRYQRKLQNRRAFVNKGFIHLRGIRELTHRFSWEVFVQREFDDFILLKDRKLIGSGIRSRLTVSSGGERTAVPLRMYAGTGLMWEDERLDTSPAREDHIVRSTNYLSLVWRVEERVHLGLVTYYQFHVSDLRDFRVLLENTFAFDLTGSLAFRMNLSLRYDHEPPPGVKSYDLELGNGLEFTF